MKLKIKIAGLKVHDVGYRYFLMSMALSNGIRRFEAHNADGAEGQEVLVFADGDDRAVDAFHVLVETKRPARSEVSNISFEDYDGEVMKIGEYAQFCSTVQLNKAIPVLLDIRDDLKAVRKNTDIIPQMSEDIKAIRKTTDSTLEEIKSMREDFQPVYGMSMQQVRADIRSIKDRLGML